MGNHALIFEKKIWDTQSVTFGFGGLFYKKIAVVFQNVFYIHQQRAKKGYEVILLTAMKKIMFK